MIRHDPGTGEEIEKREVVKGYEYSRGQFLTFTAEELKAHDVESSKVVDLEKFVAGDDIDPVCFDSPYFVYPDGPIAVEVLRVATGGWGFFDFNHFEPKAATAKLKAKEECAFCHIAGAKKDQVWTQFYRVLDKQFSVPRSRDMRRHRGSRGEGENVTAAAEHGG